MGEQSQDQVENLTEVRSRSCWNINRRFLVFKLYYGLAFGANACVHPFLSVFFQFLGMSAQQTGLIIGLQPVARFLGAPAAGAIADKYRKHRIVMLLMCSLVTGLTFSLVFFKPPESRTVERNLSTPANCNTSLPSNKSLNVDFSNNGTQQCHHIVNCTNKESFTLVCWNESGTGNSGTETKANVEDNRKTFISVLFLVLLFSLFANYNSLADAATVKYFNSVANKGSGDYGKQRLWGAVGWGTVAVLTGLSIDQSAVHLRQSQFLIPFCGYLFLNVGTAVAAYKLPMEFLEGRSKPNIFQNMQIILTDGNILTFLIAILIMGTCMATIEIFLFWFLLDIGGNHLIMGLALFMTCVTEVPFFFFSGELIRLMGHINVLYLTFACYTLRYLLYSFIPNAWYVLAIEPLHGITFGAMWAATTSYGGIISPDGMAATVMGLVTATHFGLGKIIAGFAGGPLYDRFGARALFRGLAITSVISCLLFFVSQYLLKKGARVKYAHFVDNPQEMESAFDLGMTEIDLDGSQDDFRVVE